MPGTVELGLISFRRVEVCVGFKFECIGFKGFRPLGFRVHVVYLYPQTLERVGLIGGYNTSKTIGLKISR